MAQEETQMNGGYGFISLGIFGAFLIFQRKVALILCWSSAS
jgi:hypothetical protein